MIYAVLDVETTTSNKGNPFDVTNSLLVVGIRVDGRNHVFDIGFSGLPFGDSAKTISDIFDRVDFVIGFNIKFDLHWLRNIGVSPPKAIWDCQLVEYILSAQEKGLPSLENTCQERGLGSKVEVDWTTIPSLELLTERVVKDIELTEQVFLQQRKELEDKEKLKRLCWYSCQDILTTEEMEWNGLKYDLELSKKMGDDMVKTVANLDLKLYQLIGHKFINFGSHEHISAILYGGIAKYKERGISTKRLKSGKEVSKEITFEREQGFQRLVEPIKGTSLKKSTEGRPYWKTDEKTLRSLKASGQAKRIIQLLLERAKWEKKIGTYFHGIPALYQNMNWANSMIHGQLIHCRARTGRLASKNPNQQNLDEEVRKCIVSRFPKT